MHRARVRAAWLLALLLFVPTAAAQLPPLPIPVPGGPGAGASDVHITMELGDPGGPLVPARPYALKLVIHYQYAPGGSVPPDQDIAPSGRVCGEANITNAPSWADAKVEPSHLCMIINPTFAVGGTTVDNSTFVLLNATPEAPALEPANLTVGVHVPAAGSLREASAETSRDIQPSFVGKLQVQGPPSVVVRGGTAERVPVLVRNLGNGPIEVRFRNASAPQGMKVELPERFVLQLLEERTVYVTLLSPWTGPVKGPVEFQAEGTHPTRPDLAGDALRAKFDVQGKAAVPGFESVLALAAVLAAARRLR
jgi:hypothetical protein